MGHATLHCGHRTAQHGRQGMSHRFQLLAHPHMLLRLVQHLQLGHRQQERAGMYLMPAPMPARILAKQSSMPDMGFSRAPEAPKQMPSSRPSMRSSSQPCIGSRTMPASQLA